MNFVLSIRQQKSVSPNFAAFVQSGAWFLVHWVVMLFVYVPHIKMQYLQLKVLTLINCKKLMESLVCDTNNRICMAYRYPSCPEKRKFINFHLSSSECDGIIM